MFGSTEGGQQWHEFRYSPVYGKSLGDLDNERKQSRKKTLVRYKSVRGGISPLRSAWDHRVHKKQQRQPQLELLSLTGRCLVGDARASPPLEAMQRRRPVLPVRRRKYVQWSKRPSLRYQPLKRAMDEWGGCMVL